MTEGRPPLEISFVSLSNSSFMRLGLPVTWSGLPQNLENSEKLRAVDRSTIQFQKLPAKDHSTSTKASNFPFINILKMFGCATYRDVLLLATLRYMEVTKFFSEQKLQTTDFLCSHCTMQIFNMFFWQENSNTEGSTKLKLIWDTRLGQGVLVLSV